MGRTEKPRVRTARINCRVTPLQKARWDHAAFLNKMTLTDLVTLLLEAESARIEAWAVEHDALMDRTGQPELKVGNKRRYKPTRGAPLRSRTIATETVT